MDNKYLCVTLDDEGYISSSANGFSDLPIYKNIVNVDGLSHEMLLASKLVEGEDGLYIPVLDADKYQNWLDMIAKQQEELATQLTPQQEIEKLKEEVRMLKEELKGMEPSETQQTLQRALFQAPAFLLAASQQLTDEEAEKMPDKMAAWQPGKTYEKDMVVAHKGALYRIVPQEGVTSQAHQEPGETGMLAVYRPLAPNEGEADGSLEKPFEFVYGMDVVKGLYYLYNEKVYVANQAVDNCIWYPGQAGAYIFALIS